MSAIAPNLLLREGAFSHERRHAYDGCGNGRPAGTEREMCAMTLNFGDWSALGLLAAIAIVIGSILLVAYAVRRGLFNRDLDGTIEAEGPDGTMPADADAPAPSRTLGVAGVIVLLAGVGLGILGVVTGPGGGTSATVPLTDPNDCAQTWSGCPQVTPRP
jgi:hypothetical protein